MPLSLIHFGLVRSFTVHKIVEHFTAESLNSANPERLTAARQIFRSTDYTHNTPVTWEILQTIYIIFSDPPGQNRALDR